MYAKNYVIIFMYIKFNFFKDYKVGPLKSERTVYLYGTFVRELLKAYSLLSKQSIPGFKFT